MSTQKGGGLVSRAVREALSTLMSPQLCEQLITRSLAAQGLSSVPESGTEIGEWLEGPLRCEVETVVGPDAADLMMMQLGPIAAYAAVALPKVPTPAPAAGPAPSAPAPSSSARRSSGIAAARQRDSAAARERDSMDDRATTLRFDLHEEPDWSTPTLPPTNTQARGFGSDPPTGVMNGQLSLTTRPSSDPAVRTLPPAKPVSEPAEPRPSGRITAHHGSAPAAPKPASDRVAIDPAEAKPAVLVASRSGRALEALKRCLQNASVLHIPDLVGLLDALEEPTTVEPIVVLDCHEPTVHVGSVAAIGQDLPRGTTVVLWGAAEALWHQIDRDRSPTCRWVRCSSEASADDVGSLCSMLIG